MIDVPRYLLKVMQDMEENEGADLDASVAYLSSPLECSGTAKTPNDYCRIFERRSQLCVHQPTELTIFIPIHYRLIQEASAVISKSSSPDEAFLNNSIQLVHVAKVENGSLVPSDRR